MTKFPEVVSFLEKHRQAALAVSAGEEPFTAMVGYAWDAAHTGVLIHLSNLAAHKKQLRENPRCSVLIAEADDGRAEVMSLARVTLQGHAAVLDKASDDYTQAKALFLARMPSAEMMFGLPDFDLFRIAILSGRYIACFGRIMPCLAEDLK